MSNTPAELELAEARVAASTASIFAQIFLFGAEYTWVYANRHGSRVQTPALGGEPAVPSRSGD